MINCIKNPYIINTFFVFFLLLTLLLYSSHIIIASSQNTESKQLTFTQNEQTHKITPLIQIQIADKQDNPENSISDSINGIIQRISAILNNIIEFITVTLNTLLTSFKK